MKRLQDRIAVITGAGRGIGEAICRRFAEEGAQVVVTDLDGGAAGKLAKELGSSGVFPLDVTDSAAVQAVFLAISGKFGRIDILVNNAGLFNTSGPFMSKPEAVWTRMLEINLAGTMRCTAAVLTGMCERKYGRIINLGSIAATSGLPGLAEYAAAKAGVVGFTKTVAMEAGPYGVTVNSISPGLITSTGRIGATQGNWLGHEGRREDVAALAAFLASDEGAYITGVDYLIDGGRVLGPKQR